MHQDFCDRSIELCKTRKVPLCSSMFGLEWVEVFVYLPRTDVFFHSWGSFLFLSSIYVRSASSMKALMVSFAVMYSSTLLLKSWIFAEVRHASLALKGLRGQIPSSKASRTTFLSRLLNVSFFRLKQTMKSLKDSHYLCFIVSKYATCLRCWWLQMKWDRKILPNL